MIPLRIEPHTRALGAPENWNELHPDRPCATLYIKDTPVDGANWMVSSWEPTPEEIALINSGRPIRLWVAGVAHPAVGLDVPTED